MMRHSPPRALRIRRLLLDAAERGRLPPVAHQAALDAVLEEAQRSITRTLSAWTSRAGERIGGVDLRVVLSRRGETYVRGTDAGARVRLSATDALALSDLVLSVLCVPSVAYVGTEDAEAPLHPDDLLEAPSTSGTPGFGPYESVLQGADGWHQRLTCRMPTAPRALDRWRALADAAIGYLVLHEAAHVVLGHAAALSDWREGRGSPPAPPEVIHRCLELEADNYAVDLLLLLHGNSEADAALSAVARGNEDVVRSTREALSGAALGLVWVDSFHSKSDTHPLPETRLLGLLNRAVLYAFAPHVADVEPGTATLRARSGVPPLPRGGVVPAMSSALDVALWTARFLGDDVAPSLLREVPYGGAGDPGVAFPALLADLLALAVPPYSETGLHTDAARQTVELRSLYPPVHEALEPYRRTESFLPPPP